MTKLAYGIKVGVISGVLLWCLVTSVFAQNAQQDLENRALDQARSLSQTGRVAEAEKQLQSAAALYPGSYAVHNDLGTLYLQIHRNREALHEFSLAVRLNPYDADVQRNLGTCYFIENDYSHAIEPLERAMAVDSDDLRTRYQLGYALLMLGRPQEAEPHLRFVSDRMPDDDRVAFALVKTYQAERDQDKAASAFLRLQQAHPDSVFVHLLLGEAYDIQDHLADAVAEYRKALEQAPDMPRLHFDLGFLYFKQNMAAEAEQALQEELRINPTFTPALYYLGEIALDRDDRDLAIAYFRKALAQNPACLDGYIGLGRALARADRPQDAVAAFVEANRLDGNQPDVHYMLAAEYRQLHEPEKQRQELEKLKLLNVAAKARPASGATPLDRSEGTTCLAIVGSKPIQRSPAP